MSKYMQSVKAHLTTTSAWILPREESCIAPDDVWSNKDMDPSQKDQRLWTVWTFFSYWISDLVNPGAWATVAAYVTTLGLTWWEACLAVVVGQVLVAIVITANGIAGAKIHTPFAVTSRSVYGYWGSKFVVFSRMMIAMFWCSINSWSGGIFITRAIEAIWPSYANLPNHVPAGQGATSGDFLSFFLFWLLQLPFVFIHPSKLGWVFNAKAVLVPCTALGTLIWALCAARPNIGAALNHQANRAPGGSIRFQVFMQAVTASQGTWATMALNIGDFSRYCRKPNSAWVQLLAMPFLSGTMAMFGAISAACVLQAYGKATYQPYDIVSLWSVSAGGRAAMFLASIVWALANVTTNITANSISAANDMTTLAPKLINIKRGQIIAITVGVFGFAPWKVLASASNFLNFMSSYSVVLAPLGAILAADFFIIKKQKLNIYELYKPNGIYHFWHGWNWRAYIALFSAIGPLIPGMAHAIQPTVNIGNAKYLYMLSNIVADTIGVSVYLTLNYFFPAPEAQVEEAVHELYTPEDGYGYSASQEAHDKKLEEADVQVQPVLSRM